MTSLGDIIEVEGSLYVVTGLKPDGINRYRTLRWKKKRKKLWRISLRIAYDILTTQKKNLEEQITQDTSNEIELQEAYIAQRREKLAEIIKELKILEDEKQETDALD